MIISNAKTIRLQKARKGIIDTLIVAIASSESHTRCKAQDTK